MKFYEEAATYYGHEFVFNPKNLDDILREKIDLRNPNAIGMSKTYLDFDRAFRYMGAVSSFINETRAILEVVDTPKYKEFYAGKKSPLALSDAALNLAHCLKYFKMIETNVRLYKYDYYVEAWMWAFNNWTFTEIFDELNLAYSKWPAAIELYSFAMRNFYDKVIYVRDDDVLWDRYKAIMDERLINLRLGAIGLADGAQIVLPDGSHSEVAGIAVRDLTQMPYMNDLIIMPGARFTPLDEATKKKALIITRAHGSQIDYILNELIYPSEEMKSISPADGLSEAVIEKYKTIYPFVVEDETRSKTGSKQYKMEENGETKIKPHSLAAELEELGEKPLKLERSIPEDRGTHIYETYDGKTFRRLVKYYRRLPPGSGSHEKTIFNDHHHIIDVAVIGEKYNVLLEEEIMKNCPSGLDSVEVNKLLNAEGRNMAIVDNLKQRFKQAFDEYFVKSWQPPKNPQMDVGRLLLDFIGRGQVIEKMISEDIKSRLKDSDFHYSLVNRSILRLSELKTSFRRLVGIAYKMYSPPGSKMVVGRIKEYYSAIINEAVNKLSDSPYFDDSMTNIKSILLARGGRLPAKAT
jgi:hypothetical protein